MIIQDRHPFLSATSAMREIAKPLLSLGITYFTYTKCEADGARTYLGTHPELMKLYLEKQYYLIGNIEAPPTKYRNQILFWNTLPKQHLYDELPRAHGIDHGIFLVNQEDDYCEFYGFAAPKGMDRVMNAYINNVDNLNNFVHYFKARAKSIIRQANACKLILPFHNDSLDFVNKSPGIFFDSLPSKQEITLSPRQMHCASLLLEGRQYKEIANTLGLSPRTIESHLEVLRVKLNCRNKAELLLKLSRLKTS